MNLNSKLIPQQFAALWEREVLASQKRLDERVHRAESEPTPGADNPANVLRTATPAPEIQTKPKRRVIVRTTAKSEAGLPVEEDGARITVSGLPPTELPARPPRVFRIVSPIFAIPATGETANESEDIAAYSRNVVFDLSDPGFDNAAQIPKTRRASRSSHARSESRSPGIAHVVRVAPPRAPIDVRDNEDLVPGGLQFVPERIASSASVHLRSQASPGREPVEAQVREARLRAELERVEKQIERAQSDATTDARQALLQRLAALDPAQTLAVLLLTDHSLLYPLEEQQVGMLIDKAWDRCGKLAQHRLRPPGYWKDAAASLGDLCGTRPNFIDAVSDRPLRTISLTGLLVRSNRMQVLLRLDPQCVDPFLAAAKIAVDGSTRKLSAHGVALHFVCEAFFDWVETHSTMVNGQERDRNKVLTQTLARAIESWPRAGSKNAERVSPVHLGLTMVMLRLGAMLDLEHLRLLAPHRGATGAVEIWEWMASEAHHRDQGGLAALQLMISAATFRYDLMPFAGGPNPMAHYVTANDAAAVGMFLRSGFDPVLVGQQGLSPRDHGVRAGAAHAVGVIDLYLAQKRIIGLRESAKDLRRMARLLGLERSATKR